MTNMDNSITPVTTLESSREQDVYAYYVRDIYNDVFNGDKFPGSFGKTKLFEFVDYWTLRKRSLQLFKENPYAIGIIRRLIRNEIFTGLTPEAAPIAAILWPNDNPETREQRAVEFGETMTSDFLLYGNDPTVFDFRQRLTFGEFQQQVRMEALLCGDGIIVSRINPKTNLPYWDWINGNYIRTPENYRPSDGRVIKHGVEIDINGRHVAYHVQYWDGEKLYSERIPVFGERSGRRIAWMIYGQERMLDDVRGIPILACFLYMLKELDRYRDSEARAAAINAMLPLFIKKSPTTTIGTRPTAGMSRLNPNVATEETAAPEQTAPSAPPMVGMVPGTVFDDLAPGEEPVSFQTNRPNVNYRAFEEGIVNLFCWLLEIPPEIGVLMFRSSFSASRQANNEFDVLLKYRAFKNAKDFCQFIYEEYIIQSCLIGDIDLPGFLAVLRDSAGWKKRGAWLNCSWTGISRPSIDMGKDVNAAKAAINLGITTYDQQARKVSGMSFRAVQSKLAREREMMKNLGFISSADEDQNGRPVEEGSVREELEEAIEENREEGA